MKKHGYSGRASTIPAGLAIAAATSLGVTAIGSSVTAWLILSGYFPVEWAGYCAMFILLFSAASGAGIAIARIQRLRLQMCLASGGLYYLCLLLTTAFFFGGQFRGMAVTGLVIFAGCGAVILLAPGEKKKRRPRRHKIK